MALADDIESDLGETGVDSDAVKAAVAAALATTLKGMSITFTLTDAEARPVTGTIQMNPAQ